MWPEFGEIKAMLMLQLVLAMVISFAGMLTEFKACSALCLKQEQVIAGHEKVHWREQKAQVWLQLKGCDSDSLIPENQYLKFLITGF